MTRAVNVTVVTRVGFVLDVSRVDSDTARFFFGSLVNFGVIRELGAARIGENLGNGSGQSSLAVVDVSLIAGSSAIVKKVKTVITYSANVHVRFGAREFRGGLSIPSYRNY